MSNPKNSKIENDYNNNIGIEESNNMMELSELNADEFREGVTEDFDPSDMPGISRRKFLALLSASAAFAATACTDYEDRGEIIPYTKRPSEILPGKANYYASTCNSCSQNCGILVKARAGRPIKIDGNPDHPVNKGKVCAKGHAEILNLYNPERLKAPLKDGITISWDIADKEIIDTLLTAKAYDREIALITNTITSPTTQKVLNDFQNSFPTAKIYSYELFHNAERINAWEKCYGTREVPSIKWNDANIVLALDSDFLGKEGNTVENTRLFSSRKDIIQSDNFNRLYVVEGGMSLTGMNADYRLRLRPDTQYAFVMSLLNEILIQKKISDYNVNANVITKISKYSLTNFAKQNGLDSIKLSYLINDLVENRGKAIVFAGDSLPEEVHIAVNLLNEVLGNTSIYNFDAAYVAKEKLSSNEEIFNLVSGMNNGSVDVVVHFNSNPVYHLSSEYGYSEAVNKVKTVITLAETTNETSAESQFVLPINHTLESWGDFQTRKGILSLQQPIIAPLFNTRQKESVLLTWIDGNPNSYNHDIYHLYLMSNFNESVYSKREIAASLKTFWYSALHDGIVSIEDQSGSRNALNQTTIINSNSAKLSNDYLVHLQKNYFIGEGNLANNGWLQELPHPVTKVTWDNYAAISPATAKDLDVENNDLINVTLGQNKLSLPVLVQPGMAEKLLTIELGYGRKNFSEVADDVGFNANILLNSTASISPWIFSKVNVEKGNGQYELISTQEHHSLDDTSIKDFHLTRNIIKKGTLEEFKKDPHFLHKDKHEIFSITREHEYTIEKWAMAIDLNKCTACGVCVASCNVENNVPVVGKDQVAVGREMQWMRIDRYYSGTSEDPEVSNQPMLCQHCDNAPCENVCPVNATNHSPDGLNQMVYNRCVGTRYCANNCPYKVRRFNFFNFRDHFSNAYYENEVTPLVNNPEVTVRSRGVMEKCSFCVQRIMEARSKATQDGKEFNGSDIITACQQACPADAIVFGNSNYKESKVNIYRDHDLSYHVLEELNIKPNITYLAKLKNTHSEDA
jgi:molybdopterin-containing oxidoreductase family iron-sulfur binding subunit